MPFGITTHILLHDQIYNEKSLQLRFEPSAVYLSVSAKNGVTVVQGCAISCILVLMTVVQGCACPPSQRVDAASELTAAAHQHQMILLHCQVAEASDKLLQQQ